MMRDIVAKSAASGKPHSPSDGIANTVPSGVKTAAAWPP
jgi:hypothetical protein